MNASLLLFTLACSHDTKPTTDPQETDTNTVDPGECPDDNTFFNSAIEPLIESRCVGCHVEGGVAAETRLLLKQGDSDHNYDVLTEVAQIQEAAGYLLWLKPTGQHDTGHVGGTVLALDSEEADAMAQFIGRVNDLIDDCDAEIDLETASSLDCASTDAGKRLLRRLSHVEYDNTITDIFGIESEWGSSLAPDNVQHGYNNSAEALQVSSLLVDQYMNAAEEIGSEVVGQRLDDILSCDFVDRNLDCAEDFLMSYGTKIFRRPLSTTEMETYLALFDGVYCEEGFSEAMKWTIAALLQSPHFLYRAELGRKDGDDFVLSSWEIATELSYLIWQTTPDDSLLTMAAADQLQDRAVVLEKAQEMLSDPRAAQTVVAMSEQWFSLDLLPIVAREGEYEVLTDTVRADMGMEISKLMYHSFANDVAFADLMNAQHSYMSPALAAYYGTSLGNETPDADGFQRVDLSGDSRYGGLLTQGAMLTVHALPTTSSPIHRGVLVRERFLCQELPPPPANLDTSPPAMDDSMSTRERYDIHSTDPACSSCHNLIDPIGFGFENYDGIGRWRDVDGEHEVDASGEVQNIDDGDQPFEGVFELSSILAESDQVGQCYVQQWFTYGFGQGDMEEEDLYCAVEAASEYYRSEGATLQAPLLGLIQIDRFFQRHGEAGEGDTLAIPSTYVEQNPADSEDPACENVSSELEIYVREDTNWGSGYCNTVIVTNMSA
ncbi:MAG: DUF1588 domain-containing protein, partial [Myxococcota bacterium]|nr:DUF1588 domain-containing protein [Myxococcota bacterium]